MVEGTEGKIQQRIECGKDRRPDMALMDRNQIMEIIPHRDPFLLIDEIESMDEENGTITAIKYVRESEYYFEGHFPQKKVMPGVLIVEALAQTGAVAILSRDKFRGKLAFFGGIKNAKFRSQVTPGDTLRLCVELEKLGSRAGTAKGKAYLLPREKEQESEKPKIACECEIMFVIG